MQFNVKQFYSRFRWVLMFVALIWLLQIVGLLSSFRGTYFTGQSTWALGIEPRTFSGLKGIVFSPFIHGSVLHVFGNTIPILLLGAVMAATTGEKMLRVSVFIVVFGGLGVWLFGRASFHVGASGLIFGWFGYLLVRGLVEHKAVAILTSIGVGSVYGYWLFDLFPSDGSISWEAHLFSLLAGIAAVFVFRKTSRGKSDSLG